MCLVYSLTALVILGTTDVFSRMLNVPGEAGEEVWMSNTNIKDVEVSVFYPIFKH